MQLLLRQADNRLEFSRVQLMLVESRNAAASVPAESIAYRNRKASLATFIDLFCGIGGFHYAAESLGLRCVFASEIDENACSQYEHNFGHRPEGDITKIETSRIPDHDILFGGFPCQPFSIIGKQDGFADRRGTLIYEIVRILKGKKPHAFVLENVKQIVSNNEGGTMRAILSALSAAGYDCDMRVLNALDYGLPQKRERAIIVGFRKGLKAPFSWPERKRNYKPLAKILETNPDQRHYVSEYIRERRKASHSPPETPSIWHENKGGNVSSHPFSCALRAGASYNYLLVNGERRLTPREQLRLQGFPERFEVIGSDSQIRKQTGNAVPVPMIRAVIKEVLRAAGQSA